MADASWRKTARMENDDDDGKVQVTKCASGNLDDRLEIANTYAHLRWFETFWSNAMEHRRQMQNKHLVRRLPVQPLVRLTMEYVDEHVVVYTLLQNVPSSASMSMVPCRLLVYMVGAMAYQDRETILTSVQNYRDERQLIVVTAMTQLKRAREQAGPLAIAHWHLRLCRSTNSLIMWDGICDRLDSIFDECVRKEWLKRTVL